MNPLTEHSPQTSRSTELFRGQYCFRTLNGATAAVVPSAFGIMFAYISVQLLGERNDIGFGFAFSALIFGGLGLYALLSLIANKRIKVEINEEGIIIGNRLWRWNEVNSITGKKYFNGVCIEFSASGRKMSAPTTPFLTEQNYIEIVQELHRRIAGRFPNVKIAMLPVDASDTS